MPTEDTVSALQQAAAGLTYQSETDGPWKAFGWPKATGAPSVAGVRQWGKHKPDAAAEEQAVDEFFAPLIEEQDWYGDAEKADTAKYRALLAVVKQRLRDARVIRIGARKVAIYIVGVAPEGGWAGLKTTAVET